jgi:LCP family protein required for cell wall assembly
MLRAMQSPGWPRRGPSPFVAAVLSLIFPGLGQLYAGRPARALGFAALPFLALALVGGVLAQKASRQALMATVLSPDVLQVVFVLDILVAIYRIVAVVDAWGVASLAAGRTAGAIGTGSAFGPAPRPRTGTGSPGPGAAATLAATGRIASVAGLAAVVLVLLTGHVALGRYDRIAFETITGITDGSNGGDAPDATSSPGSSANGGASASPGESLAPLASAVPWNGTDRLNVLLVGSDQRKGDTTFNTDTMIVASIDPASGQVAMFSVPRDTENVPLPPGSAAARAFTGGVYPNRINSLWSFAAGSPGIFPGTSSTARGAAALKGALGTMLGIDIKYYVMVNFAGFQSVIDTLGGVTIDVQNPVQDYSFPSMGDGGQLKLYIPPGIQHMSGAQALEYARSRHQTNDFDRAGRQQRVVTSVRAQMDVLSLLDPNKLQTLSSELKAAIRTDFPSSLVSPLVSLAEKVDLANLRSFVFTPPVYQTECSPAQCVVHYFIHPRLDAIQQTVKNAFTVDPKLAQSRLKLAAENATVWVLSGTHSTGTTSTLVNYLDYTGVGAVVGPVNGGRADKATYPDTVVTFYNGAEATMPETVAVLQKTFGVTIVTATDPAMKADVVVITGTSTPPLKVPKS